MKRHPSFIPFSHDHRRALFLAQVIRSSGPGHPGYPSDTESRKNYALSFYNSGLAEHFRQEEELLLPLAGQYGVTTDNLLTRMKQEHETLAALFSELSTATGEAAAKLMDDTGTLLEKHIRMEERELFEILQKVLDESQLEKIAKYLQMEKQQRK